MPIFSTFQKEHEARHGARYKASGLASYRSYVRAQLLPAFGGKRLDAIGRIDIIRWFETYSLTSPGGANRALGILAQMLHCAKAWGYLPGDWINPASGLRCNRRNRMGSFLSMAQMERLGRVLSDQASQGCLASALLHVLALTGCRVGEIIRLEWRDVPLGASAHRYLAARRQTSTALQGRVFPFPEQCPYEAVRKVWKMAKGKADLPAALRIHDLRHSFASHAIMAGESLFTVSRLLGHSRVQTTARYAHLADHALLDCAETIGRHILAQAMPAPPRTSRRVSAHRDDRVAHDVEIPEEAHANQLHGHRQHGDRIPS